jgi:bacillithiol synthase
MTIAVASTPPSRRTVRRVPFSTISSFSRLFRDYCERYEDVAEFFAGDFRDVEARRSAADRAALVERDREVVSRVLLDQNEAWGLDDAARSNIDALARPETVAVVTGQQIGLFTGPLYTIYKTVTVLQLARRLQDETGRPVVPVFWVEGEDHDYEEVAAATLLHQNEPVTIRYDRPPASGGGNVGPVGRLVLDGDIAELMAALDGVLPPTEFSGELMSAVREAYAPGRRLEDAFVLLMKTVFPNSGLVFMNPDDQRLKRMSAPLFRRDLEQPDELMSGMDAVNERLKDRYHVQVHVRPTNLFLIEPEGRFPIDTAGDGSFQLRGRERSFSREELLAMVDSEPERFSPNVVLRPLMQDILLPTALYVAGPGEIAYFAQFRPVYEWAGLPMPVIYPRASVSLVEPKVRKVMDKFDISVEDFSGDLGRLFQRIVLDTMEVDVEAVFKEASRPLHEAVNGLKPSLEKVDRTLARSAEATRVSLLKEMEKLKDRVVRAEKRNQDDVRDQLQKAHVNLFPNGKLQERILSVLYVLNKFGPSFTAELADELSMDTTAHQVVEL